LLVSVFGFWLNYVYFNLITVVIGLKLMEFEVNFIYNDGLIKSESWLRWCN